MALVLAGCAGSGPVNQRYASSAQPLDILDTTAREATFLADDGKELGYVHYKASGASSEVALVYLHGIESHAGWFKMASERLQARGFAWIAAVAVSIVRIAASSPVISTPMRR